MPQPPYAIIPTRGYRRPRRYGLLLLGGFVLAGAGVAAALLLLPAGALPDKRERMVSLSSNSPPSTLAVTAPAGVPTLARSASVCITCGTVETVLGPEPGKAGPAYRVQVRMDDGSVRSFASATQLQPGVAVRVDGDNFRVVSGGG